MVFFSFRSVFSLLFFNFYFICRRFAFLRARWNYERLNAASTFGSIMCCGSTNDNHEINMSERTSACHPFTSQHTHSCTASPCRHVDDRRRAFVGMTERWRARRRDQRIQLQTDDTSYDCAKSFHLYRRHYSPRANKNEEKYQFFCCRIFIVRSLSSHNNSTTFISSLRNQFRDAHRWWRIENLHRCDGDIVYLRESTQNKHLTHELDANQRQINASIFWTDSHRKSTQNSHTEWMES